jgi:co-chaperonin GroES (HSP10)
MGAIGKYVAVEPINEEVKTDYGLLLTQDEMKDVRYVKGRVVSPGTEVFTVKEKDEILYDKARAFQMSIKGKWLTIISERDIVFVL